MQPQHKNTVPTQQQQQNQQNQQPQQLSGILLSQVGSSKNWAEKYFVLQDGVLLGYPVRDRQRQRRPEMHIPLQEAFIRLSQELYPKYFCFQVVTTNEICSFIAQTHQDLIRWTQLMASCSHVIRENLFIEKLDNEIRHAECRTSTPVLPSSPSTKNASLNSDTMLRRRYIASLRLTDPNLRNIPSSPPSTTILERHPHASLLSTSTTAADQQVLKIGNTKEEEEEADEEEEKEEASGGCGIKGGGGEGQEEYDNMDSISDQPDDLGSDFHHVEVGVDVITTLLCNSDVVSPEKPTNRPNAQQHGGSSRRFSSEFEFI